jgi:hypothetical protein
MVGSSLGGGVSIICTTGIKIKIHKEQLEQKGPCAWLQAEGLRDQDRKGTCKAQNLYKKKI